jgi:hypothetical protein
MRNRLLLTALAAVCVLSFAGCDPSAAVPGVSSTLKSSLTNFAGANAIPNQRYFRDGVWTTTDVPGVWAKTNAGPPLAAARLWAATGKQDRAAFDQAVSTYETAMATQQAATGRFGPDSIANTWFGISMGQAYLMLKDGLTPAQRAAWSSSIARAADYLTINTDAVYYPNGNIAIAYTELFYLAYAATGDAKFKTAYDKSLANALRPRQDMYPGRGWVSTKTPTQADGSDGAGYFTEEGKGGVGFDPEYAMAQLSVVSNLWLASKDPRVLSITNQLLNTLLPLVTDRTVDQRFPRHFMLNATGGTRHQYPAGTYRLFDTPAVALLAWSGKRPDLLQMSVGQVSDVNTYFREELNWPSNPVHYSDLGRDVAAMLIAAAPAAQPAPR